MSEAAARKTEAKKRIREIRAEIGQALGANDRTRVGKLRGEVKRLKRKTRALAKEAAAAPAGVTTDPSAPAAATPKEA